VPRMASDLHASRPRRTRTLSEPDSKALVARHGVRIAREARVADPEAAARAAEALGYPVVLKLAGEYLKPVVERAVPAAGPAASAAVRAAKSEA